MTMHVKGVGEYEIRLEVPEPDLRGEYQDLPVLYLTIGDGGGKFQIQCKVVPGNVPIGEGADVDVLSLAYLHSWVLNARNDVQAKYKLLDAYACQNAKDHLEVQKKAREMVLVEWEMKKEIDRLKYELAAWENRKVIKGSGRRIVVG